MANYFITHILHILNCSPTLIAFFHELSELPVCMYVHVYWMIKYNSFPHIKQLYEYNNIRIAQERFIGCLNSWDRFYLSLQPTAI